MLRSGTNTGQFNQGQVLYTQLLCVGLRQYRQSHTRDTHFRNAQVKYKYWSIQPRSSVVHTITVYRLEVVSPKSYQRYSSQECSGQVQYWSNQPRSSVVHSITVYRFEVLSLKSYKIFISGMLRSITNLNSAADYQTFKPYFDFRMMNYMLFLDN